MIQYYEYNINKVQDGSRVYPDNHAHVSHSVVFLYHRSTEGGMGVYWIHPDVCPSVCPFVHGLFVSWGATGWRFVINSRANIHVTIDCSTVLPVVLGIVTRHKLQSMDLWYWELMSRPDPAVLPVGTLHSLEWFWVSRRIFIYSHHNTSVFLSKMAVCTQGFQNFLKKLLAQFISYLAFTLMGWVSWSLFIFVFLASILALWWPNIWRIMGFPELFEKTIGPIHFIPGIYPNGVSLLTPIQFRVPSLIFGPLVAKYLAENGKSYWLNSFYTWHLFTLMGSSFLTPIHFRVPSLIFSPLVAKYLAENGVSGTFKKNYWLNSMFSWRIPTCVAHDCKI